MVFQPRGILTEVRLRETLRVPAKVALLNAFGFGSNNAALVFKKWQ